MTLKRSPLIIKRLLLSLFSIALFSQALGQYQSKPFEVLTKEDGLPSNSIFKIFQDREGYLWFGTMHGLCRYDGYSIIKYQRKAHSSNSLTDNWINQMAQDHYGNLWLGTHNGGLTRYNQKTERYINFKSVDSLAPLIKSPLIWEIYPDSEKKLWVGHNRGVERIDPQTLQPARLKGHNEIVQLVGNRAVNTIVEHPNYYFIGTWKGGLIVYDKKTDKPRVFLPDADDASAIPGKKIKDLLLYDDSTLFVATQRKGMFWLNINTWKFYRPQHQTLRTAFITKLTKDKLGNVWIGSQRDGMFQFNPKTGSTFSYSYNAHIDFGLPDNWVSDLLVDRSGLLWAGTGRGVCKTLTQESGFMNYRMDLLLQDGESTEVNSLLVTDKHLWLGTIGKKVQVFDLERQELIEKHTAFLGEKLKSNRIWSMCPDSSGNIWLGTDQGLGRYTPETQELKMFYSSSRNPDGLVYNNITNIMFDGKKLWIGTYSGGFSIYDPDTDTFENFRKGKGPHDLSSNFVMNFMKDSQGYIWLGTSDGGLNRFDYKNKRFKVYRHDFNDPNSIPSDNINNVAENPDGTFYIATEGGGFCHFDPKKEKFTSYSETDGLLNNHVLKIIHGKDNVLWLPTARGISRFNTVSKEFESLSLQNGLLLSHFTKGYAPMPNGDFWLSTKLGFVMVEPDKVKTTPFAPEIRLTKFKRFNKPENLRRLLDKDSVLHLKHNDYVLSFDFAALDFRAPEKNRYAYIFEGLEDNWMQIENLHTITVPALPSGSYTLRVRGTNSEGKWSENELALHIEVSPPFYKTTWFYTFVCLLFSGSIYMLFQWRTQNLISKRKELTEQVAIRTNELEAEKHKVEEYSHEVEKQRDFVMQQRDLIVAQNKELTDSIVYAQRIQNGLLPNADNLVKHFRHSFILFKPRDIVSGDFYWYAEHKNYLYLTVADCTGHGVPGAFMSLLGISYLNEILKTSHCPDTSDVLNKLRMQITNTLSKGGQEKKVREGMDMALVRIDKQKMEMQFSGAYNGLYLLRKNVTKIDHSDRDYYSEDGSVMLAEFRGQRNPIAKFEKQREGFTHKQIQLESGDRVYMLTDGFVDQLNSKMERKYFAKNLKKKLLEVQDKSLAEQQLFLENEHNNWKGDARQIDDILALGFEL